MCTLLNWLTAHPLRVALAVAVLIFMHAPVMLVLGGGLLILCFLSQGRQALVWPIGLSVALVWLLELLLRERTPFSLISGESVSPPWEWTIALALVGAISLSYGRSWGTVLGTQCLLSGAGYLLLRYLAPAALAIEGERITELLQQIWHAAEINTMPPPVIEAHLVAAMYGTLVGLTAILCLIVGRYWQSLLFNPGGFGAEFQRLQLPLWVLLPLCLLYGAAVMAPQSHYDWLLILFPTLWIASAALAHGMVAAGQLSSAWLVLHYILIMLTPLPAMVALALDSQLNFRQRLARRWQATDGNIQGSPTERPNHHSDTEI